MIPTGHEFRRVPVEFGWGQTVGCRTRSGRARPRTTPTIQESFLEAPSLCRRHRHRRGACSHPEPCFAATAAGRPAAPCERPAPAVCPGTFQVLNNDHVGTLSLPAGPYVISITGNLSCTQASSLFTTFLDQWTGDLPGGWVVTSDGFRKGATAFTVARSHHKPPSPAPSSRTCPGTFSVLHNDRIGAASFAQGNYVVTLLKASTSHFSCQTASRTFAYFLNTRSSKPLPYPWLLTTKTRTFTEKTNGVGFRVAQSTLLGAPQTGPKVTAGGGRDRGHTVPAARTR